MVARSRALARLGAELSAQRYLHETKTETGEPDEQRECSHDNRRAKAAKLSQIFTNLADFVLQFRTQLSTLVLHFRAQRSNLVSEGIEPLIDNLKSLIDNLKSLMNTLELSINVEKALVKTLLETRESIVGSLFRGDEAVVKPHF
jgi:molecular chaperone GrpE (heat shock protein)